MFFFLNTLIRKARKKRLPPSEKAEVRRELETFVRTYPLKDTNALDQRPERLVGFWSRLVALRPVLLKPLPIALLILFALGAGTVSAAEEVLPDHPLYFIKTHVSEPVRRSLARTPEKKAAVETDIAVRRLDEARVLAKQGTLTPKQQGEAKTRFIESAARVETQVKKLAASGRVLKAEALADAFEMRVEHRTNLIHAFQGEVLLPTSTSAVSPLATSTRQILPVLKKAREKLEEIKEERKELRKEQKKEKEEKERKPDQPKRARATTSTRASPGEDAPRERVRTVPPRESLRERAD